MAITRGTHEIKPIPSICIVEDESIVALDIKRILTNGGYRIGGVFSSGEAILEYLTRDYCDLILMDIKIAGSLDGIETARIISDQYQIPIIMLTAFADDATIARVKELGPFGYIIKPFEDRELKTAIEMAFVRFSLEARLQESEERYRLLFEEDLSGDFLADGDGILIDYNSAFAKMLELDEHDGQTIESIETLFPDSIEYQRFLVRIYAEEVLKLQELKLKTANGRSIIVLANIIAKTGKVNGEILEIKGYLIDITDRKNLEQQLRQSQKMEAIGRLAGGVAHDFNNLLTVIIGYCSMIQGDDQPNSDVITHVDGILDATSKASALTRQLLAFSRQQLLNPRIIEANAQLLHLEKMLNRLLPDNISFYFSPSDEKAFLYIDPGQLEQVIINLVVNARDASPDGGVITLGVDSMRIQKDTPASTGIIHPGDYIRVFVRDTGSGIDPLVIQHIFEPFFTTKPSDKGTGLGLAMVYGIVSQSNGIIDVQTTEGKGSVFFLYFPKPKTAVVSAASDEKPPKTVYPGSETVLFVEDDPKIRDILRQSLMNSGYTVLAAANPGEAILILERLGEDGGIDLVVSDLLMPYMNGIELISRIRVQLPGVKYLLMSGFPEGHEKFNTNEFSADHIILKPFSPEELLAKMRVILDT
ncbi:MAG: response regulator [Spirochaetales bacterium]|nr:response regulator [Spirochaetales bacterium]